MLFDFKMWRHYLYFMLYTFSNFQNKRFLYKNFVLILFLDSYSPFTFGSPELRFFIPGIPSFQLTLSDVKIQFKYDVRIATSCIFVILPPYIAFSHNPRTYDHLVVLLSVNCFYKHDYNMTVFIMSFLKEERISKVCE